MRMGERLSATGHTGLIQAFPNHEDPTVVKEGVPEKFTNYSD